MAYLYVLVNLAILSGPLALSFDRKVAFYRSWPRVGVSLLVVSTVYLVWDAIVTSIGHWWFNPEYSGLLRIAGLPLGEILFFVTVPYACLFIYEVVRVYFPERRARRVRTVRIIGLLGAGVFVVLVVVFASQGYTALAMVSVAVLLVVTVVFDPSMWMSTHTLLFLVLSYIPFLLANGVLTALPIVGYNPEAIWGIRVYTIPVEDFFYNLGMLGFYLFVFRLAGGRGGRERDELTGDVATTEQGAAGRRATGAPERSAPGPQTGADADAQAYPRPPEEA